MADPGEEPVSEFEALYIEDAVPLSVLAEPDALPPVIVGFPRVKEIVV